jgi:hypothetical protein
VGGWSGFRFGRGGGLIFLLVSLCGVLVPFFGVVCRDSEEGVGEHGKGDMSMPCVPGADLVVVESGFVLRGLGMGRPRGEVPAGQVLFRADCRRTGRARFPGISALQ